MHVIIGGCGRLGAEIADELARDPDTDVVVIDTDPRAFDRLGSSFNGDTVTGSCNDRDVLERAGVRGADGLIAVTRFDNTNLMAVEIATHLYAVPHTMARLFNPDRERVYQKLGVRYVSTTTMIAKTFLNEFRSDAHPLHVSFPAGDVRIVELTVDTGGHAMSVEDLEQDGLLRVAAVTRGGRVFVPRHGDRLELGDRLTAAMRPAAERDLTGLVRPPVGRARTRDGE
jgi:trk system potassium uptake protein